jgi:very-short-patch-repair endonuclease
MTKQKQSALDRIELDFVALGLPDPVREYRFHPPRRWRFDYCWPPAKIAVEIDGGTWVAGRHTSGAGYEKDAEKFNQAALDGWRVFHFTTKMVTDGRASGTLDMLPLDVLAAMRGFR